MVEPEWNAMRDILTPIPAVNMKELFAYARLKNVGLWLWTEALALSRNREAVLDSFQRWGAAGLMVDFFNRNDQLTVNELEEIAASAARHKLMLMFHGVFPHQVLNVPGQMYLPAKQCSVRNTINGAIGAPRIIIS